MGRLALLSWNFFQKRLSVPPVSSPAWLQQPLTIFWPCDFAFFGLSVGKSHHVPLWVGSLLPTQVSTQPGLGYVSPMGLILRCLCERRWFW